MNIENKKIVFKIKIPNLSGNEEIEEISILEIKLKNIYNVKKITLKFNLNVLHGQSR